ncbi:hypothetical protein ACRAWF_17580 [Streptomyces sp. L7]
MRRVAQEALTNVRKHAPGAKVRASAGVRRARGEGWTYGTRAVRPVN